MSELNFETPESVQISYQLAGLGTRFIAWFIDIILLSALLFVIVMALLCAGMASESVMRSLDSMMNRGSGHSDPAAFIYFLGFITLVIGFGTLAYFGLGEYFGRGATFGKKWLGIRVVKTDGFSLDLSSILVRSIFRLIDHTPALWIVVLVTPRSQRLGDLVAGTVVVVDQARGLEEARGVLDTRTTVVDLKYAFDRAALTRARPQDVVAVEKILARWSALSVAEQETLLDRVTTPLASRLQVEPPPREDRLRFLEDFLAAESRRRHHRLG